MLDPSARILIVDDMASNRSLLKEQLRALGFSSFSEAKHGQDALALLLSLAGTPAGVELVLADLSMPVMSGLELLRKVRATPAIAKVFFAVVSSEGDISKVKEVFDSGANAYLHKPFRLEALEKTIASLREGKPFRHDHAEKPPAGHSSRGKEALVVDAVIGAIDVTLRTLMDTEARLEAPFTRGEKPIPKTDVVAAVGFFSPEVHGSIFLAFPEATYLALMSRYFSREATEMTYDVRDGAAELLNVIMGQTRRNLRAAAIEVKPAIPSLVHGSQIQSLSSYEKRSRIIVFHCDAGDFFAELMVTAQGE